MPPTQPPTEPPTQAKCESWCKDMMPWECPYNALHCGGCPACKSVLSTPPPSPASQVPTMPPTQPPTEPPTQPPTEPPTQAKCESWCESMIHNPSVDCLPTNSPLNALHCGGCPACKSVLS